MKYLYFALAVAFIGSYASAENQSPMSEPEFIKEYLEELKQKGFNKDIMPIGNGGFGSPVEVQCSMYVMGVHKVDDVSMDYEIEFYFRQGWNDSRLSYFDKDISEVVMNDPGKIWVPDLFFIQEKRGIHHQLISPNTFIRISPSGEVLYSVRLTLTLSCPMDFSKFPHDVQKCTFSVESYGRSTSKMELDWKNKSDLSFHKDIKTYDFKLTDVTRGTAREKVQSNTYSSLQVTFTFQRFSGFYWTHLYLPYIFLVMISWLSFWIPSKMVALRLSLLLVILYLMVTIGSEINSYAPPTFYIKGSDIWISVCAALVFAAFLQFIAVFIIARNTEKLRKRMCKSDPETQRVLDTDAKITVENNLSSNSAVHIMACRLKNDDQLPKRIDKICGIIFPIFFVVFSVVYFLVYCTGN